MPPATPPNPTPIYRLVHVDNLATLLTRGSVHAPNTAPQDGLPYKAIHDTEVQRSRHARQVPCRHGGTIHDYVPFYFGPLSPMLFRLKTGWVTGYDEGQEPLVYLVATAQAVAQTGRPFVFTDGHGLANFTRWFDELSRLAEVDWGMVGARYWRDTPADNDRQRRKQAEFLVKDYLEWGCGRNRVMNAKIRNQVQAILQQFPHRQQPVVQIRRGWYYD